MTKKQSLKQFFPPVVFIATIGFVATDIYLPSFPDIAKTLGTTSQFVQMSLSFYLLTFSISQLFYGPFSEKYGRKRVALFGLFFSLIGSAICTLSFDISLLIFGRLLQGLGLGIGPTLFRAILRDVFDGNRLAKAASIISVASSAAMAAAPALGGYIQKYLGWRYNFLFIILYICIGIALIWLWLPETLLEKKPTATNLGIVRTKFFSLIRSSVFMSYALCATLALSGLMAYFSISPFVLQSILKLSPVIYGWIALLAAAGLGLGGFLNSMLVEKVGRQKMLVFGVFSMIFGSFLLLLLAFFYLNTLVIVLPIFLYIVGAGITFGNCNASALHHFAEIAGFSGALYGALQIFGTSLGTFVISLFHVQNQMPLAVFLCIVSIIAALFQWLGHHASKKLEQHF